MRRPRRAKAPAAGAPTPAASPGGETGVCGGTTLQHTGAGEKGGGGRHVAGLGGGCIAIKLKSSKISKPNAFIRIWPPSSRIIALDLSRITS